jgi:hypothetical protein
LTLTGQLTGQLVAVVVLPQAAAAQVDAVTRAVTQAGGKVGSVVRLTDAWADPDQQDVLGRVAQGLDRQVTDANASVAAGQALADALVTPSPTAVAPSDPGKIDPQGVVVISGFSEAGFIKVDDIKTVRRAALALVVSPSTAPDVSVTDTFLPLISSLEADGKGVVVGGDETSTETGGVVAVVRGSDLSKTVSTVDDLDLKMGSPTAVLALASLLSGTVGQYGIHQGATDVVPSVAAQ